MRVDPRQCDIIAPNLKRRYSGVTSTIMRLVPIQARDVAIATVGPRLPADVPQIRLRDIITMPRRGPRGARIWHARRNNEMLVGLILRAILRKRLRLVFTSASQRRHTGYTRWLIRQMDAVIATSAKSAAYLQCPATVIRHGIDTTAFAPTRDRAALRRKLGLDPAARLVACIGRIRPSKGTDLFVDAMIELLPDLPGTQALILGGVAPGFEAFAAGLRDRIDRTGLSDHLRFMPEVAPWEVAPWFQAVDLYVAPQRHEGFGLTPLESMACGTPVVATTAGAFEELLIDGETGLIVPAGDYPALRGAIARALADPARLARWAAAGPAHVAERFRIEGEAAAINAVYAQLLGKG